MNDQKENLISSWKNIAKYLNCHTKTCYRWYKKYGMPVHKVDESSGATVFAYKEELDLWLKQRCSNDPGFKDGLSDDLNEKISNKGSEKKKSIAQKNFVFLPLLFLPLLIYFIVTKSNDNIPYDFQIKGSKLIIISENGKKLWSKDFGIPNLLPESEYRKHFQVKKRVASQQLNIYPYLIIRDINGDKKPEVLFSIQTWDELNEGELICFDYKGTERWTFKSGRIMNYDGKEYSNDYRIFGFDVLDFDKDGNSEIFIKSMHKIDFPCQIVLLDNKGKITGEYWNSGHISDYAVVDINQDSKDELILIGINNEFATGCLLIFDPNDMDGCSMQSGKWKCDSITERGTEKYYVIFPRTDVDEFLGAVECANLLFAMQNNRFSVTMGSSILIYELNFNLEAVEVLDSHRFSENHAQLKREGKISSILNEQYLEQLKRKFLYNNGKAWVSIPSMSNGW